MRKKTRNSKLGTVHTKSNLVTESKQEKEIASNNKEEDFFLYEEHSVVQGSIPTHLVKSPRSSVARLSFINYIGR